MDFGSMQTLNDVVKTFGNNPVLPLLASGGLTVWLITNLKQIWANIKSFAAALISFRIHNAYEDDSSHGWYVNQKQKIFNLIVSQSYPLWERTKQLDFQNAYSFTSKKYDLRQLDNTYGFSIRWMYGSLVLCQRWQDTNHQKITIHTELKVFFAWKKKFINKLNAEIDAISKEIDEEERVRDNIHVLYGSNNGCAQKMKRSFGSIFTNDDIHLKLFDDIKKFIDNKKTYKKLNYPYKYSALLYGDPGAGKSSTILAIASALNRNIEYVNLATSTISSLIDRLNNDTKNKIFVFEDVDALTVDSATNRETSSDKSNNQMCVVNQGDSIKMFTISLSDLLNITDGLLSSDGAICIFTTNHIEKLDPALLRAGRMNKIVKFEYLSASTATKMAETYLGHKPSIAFKDSIKPAELQEELLSIVLGKKTEAEAMEKFRA